ncbi:acid-sensing ion channel 4-A-like [Centruroides vittatus]|uniref:acid-sensing ion channel 4-A-like n=1 Tax=Centruroides vittatus TaxID=120091 RepID=UPI00350F314E
MNFYESENYGIFSANVPRRFGKIDKPSFGNTFEVPKLQNKRKLIKTLVFFICLSGCSYQTGRFLTFYFAYPTSLNIIVEHKAEMQPPGLTVCNSNRFRRTEFCKMFPDRCQHSDNTLICKHSYNESLCNQKQTILMPKKNSDKEFEKICNRTLNVLLGHLPYPFVKRIELLPTDDTILVVKENYTVVPMSEGVTCPRNCYLLNSLLLNPYREMTNISLKTEERKIMKLFLDLEPEEYLRPNNSIEGLVHLHSPFVTENPYIHGFIVKPGNIYYVDINMIEKFTLPPPYITNCEDYFEEWRAKGSGPLSWEMCVQHCKMVKARSECGCVPNRIMYPHEERYCLERDKECLNNADLLKCYDKCKKSCYQRKFQYTVAWKEIPQDLLHFYEYIWEYQTKRMKKRAVIMIITLRDPETLTYRSSPEYETIELFSYLGGYTGMWLGISLFTIYDFLESKVIKYFAKKKKNKKILCMNKNEFSPPTNFNTYGSYKQKPKVIKRVEVTHLY